MQTTDALQAEHLGVLMVLDQLDRVIDAAERGAKVPAEIFRDIQEFFGVFVDRCHHTKEEAELFPRLKAHGAGAIARRLEEEHALGRTLAAAYGQAVDDYMAVTGANARLASAARAYADFLRAHIELETRELFPAVELALAEEDQALTEAFERIEVDWIGAGTHERLHRMIEGLPARVDAYVRRPLATGG
jgi:hemerythrin-like domain-containing protein